MKREMWVDEQERAKTQTYLYSNHNKWFDAKILLETLDALTMNSAKYPSLQHHHKSEIALNINIIWKRIQFDYRFN